MTQQSGTNWTVNVSAANLDPDANLIDFIVLFGGVIQSNSNFQKITQSSIKYIGASLGTTNVEVRRRTPLNPIKEVKYGRRFESSDWNAELNRIARRAAEYEAFGIGSVSGTVAPVDGTYGSSWSTDSVYAPTRRRVYDKVESVVSGYQAADSGLQTQINTLTSDYQSADSNLQSQVNTTNTNLSTTNTNVTNLSNNKADKASPALAGTPTTPTAVAGTNTTQIASTAFVSQSNRPYVKASRLTSAQAIPHNTLTAVIFNNEVNDTNNAYNPANGQFVVPAGLGGTYQVSAMIGMDAANTGLVLTVAVNGVTGRFLNQINTGSTDNTIFISGCGLINVNAGDAITISILHINSTSAVRSVQPNATSSVLEIIRVNV